MDSKIKIWEVYNRRRLVQTYSGHKQAVRDVSFNNEGTQFLSASYDRYEMRLKHLGGFLGPNLILSDIAKIGHEDHRVM